jgi:hypothetical protein
MKWFFDKRLSVNHIGILEILICFPFFTEAQLRLISTQKNSHYNSYTTVIDRVTGAIYTEELVPKKEYIVHAFNGVVYTRQKNVSDTQKCEALKKYVVTKGKATVIANFDMPFPTHITFFQNGGFALIGLLGEGGGYESKIEIYSKDFQLMESFTPYSSGIGAARFHSDGKQMIISVRAEGKPNSKFMVIDEKGKKLIEKEIDPRQGEINKVYCSSDFYCINIINFDKLSNLITVYNKSGNQLWSKAAFAPLEWCFTSNKNPILITTSSDAILLYDGLTGNQIGQKTYSSIYAEALVTKLRPDGYTGVNSLISFPNSNRICFLLSEIDERKGNLLYVFDRTFGTNYCHPTNFQ